MFVSVDKNQLITAVSDHPISISGQRTESLPGANPADIGSRFGPAQPIKPPSDIRVAFVCNWRDRCGISTYSKFLVTELEKIVGSVRVFSEAGRGDGQDEDNVVRCWQRGKSMKDAVDSVLAWRPDFVIVQHEFGIFPNACYFLQMLEMLAGVPYVVCMHSVYEHLDKTVCSAAVKHAVVHTEAGKRVMLSRGHTNDITVIPHGCVRFDDAEELWNIFQTPYTVVQFGFGFFYKGVDRAIEAVYKLKTTDPKFKDLFYVYLAAENPHNARIHDNYHAFLMDRVKSLGLEDNVVIIRGFQSEQTINNYLRTAKLAIFPYTNNKDNTVYGASGAARVAMANRIPVVASESHLFDDLEGVVPRPASVDELAGEIDALFSSEQRRKSLLSRADEFVGANTWDKAAARYLDVYRKITATSSRRAT